MDPAFLINKSTESTSCLIVLNPSALRSFLYLFIGSMVSILTVSGNLLVTTSVIYFKQLHTPTNYLILSLAVADLLVGALISLFNMTLNVQLGSQSGDFFCKARRSLDISLMSSSILNMCCISVDRYFAICHPLTYKTKVTVTVVSLMILFSWTVSVLSGFGIIFGGLKNTVCDARCFLFRIPLSNVIGTAVSFYLPVIIMFIIYLRIFFVAQKQANSIQNLTCQSKKSGAIASKMERKATKTLAIVMGVFLFCWTPFFLSITVKQVTNAVPLILIETVVWLGRCNSMLNPFVYGCFYSWFRSAFKLIISGKIVNSNLKNAKLS
ncbi:trace amine-associated receptor 1-like [Nothobranchius furzeri]|uniref:trace amine-associated receptor 1-like n=1 Tax=Nothobranchius furzeri TaxID=105023 RepID=UPI0024043E2F|nr:trace amine-associated receptor 1-like [Nothobranchius furzeri]